MYLILQDTDLVCQWVKTAYGLKDESYHEAFSQEMIRQGRRNGSKIETITNELGVVKEKKVPVWFWFNIKN